MAQVVVQGGRPNALGTERLLLSLRAQQGVVQGVFAELSLDLALAQWKTNNAIKRNDRSRVLRSPRPKPPSTCLPAPSGLGACQRGDGRDPEEARGKHREHLLLGVLRVDEGTADFFII